MENGGGENVYLLTGFLGLVSMVAPYLFDYSQNPAALWVSLGIGAILVIASIFEGLAADKERWEYWVAGAAGVVAILAPFALGFSGITTALWSLVIIGAVAVLSAWTKLYPGQTQWR